MHCLKSQKGGWVQVGRNEKKTPTAFDMGMPRDVNRDENPPEKFNTRTMRRKVLPVWATTKTRGKYICPQKECVNTRNFPL